MKSWKKMVLLGSTIIISLVGCSVSNNGNEDTIQTGFIGNNSKQDYLIYGDSTDEKGVAGFVAEYDTLVYFGLNDEGKFVSTFRYFKSSGNDYKSIKQKMIDCISLLDRNVSGACVDQIKVSNMDNLEFYAPTNIVFATNRPSITFDAVPLVFGRSLLADHPGYNDGPGVPAGDKRKAKPNKSFYNASVNEENGRQLVYVSNYFTKKGGGNENGPGRGDEPIGPKDTYWYSLNIIVNVDQAGGNPIKIIIDPDSGNMGGGVKP